MSNLAVIASDLGKRYAIGHSPSFQTLRERISHAASAPARAIFAAARRAHRAPPNSIPTADLIWALRHISFQIKHGEAVGVIGRNGAGKSTLLKILSRITEPTEGEAFIHGRVASLLEVGIGFHPELTGRENIYLNGAILGMTRPDLARRFDDIVAFAEIERFIDTPVKHYSSGMYLRLAFAVAAHLEPDILIVDEVLAVGDAVFQKKCLGKMEEVAGQGRTVIFVTHNMDAVQALCHRSILMRNGTVELDGDTSTVVTTYFKEAFGRLQCRYQHSPSLDESTDAGGVLLEAEILDATGEPCEHLRFGEAFSVRMVWDYRARLPGIFYWIWVTDQRGRLLCAANTRDGDLVLQSVGIQSVTCVFDQNAFVPGEYYISIGCYTPFNPVSVLDPCLTLAVISIPFDPDYAFDTTNASIFSMRAHWEQG
jgi:lipopolysaccharide transport system ATP-binding protein